MNKRSAPSPSKRASTTRPSRSASPSPASRARRTADSWALRLYVAGQTPKSIAAYTNLKKICEEHLKGRYTIEVIDLVHNPQLAQGDQILAIPTLVRKIPAPIKKIIGDLSNTERVIIGFDLRTDLAVNG